MTSINILRYTEKTRAEDTISDDEYKNLYAQRYAYILLPAVKLQTTDTICGIIKIVHLIL